MNTHPAHRATSAATVARRWLPALLAACVCTAAAAQGGALDASMQPIKKKPATSTTCADCAADDPAIAGAIDLKGSERVGPEFPGAASGETSDDGATGGSNSELNLPSMDSTGAGPGDVGTPAVPTVTLP